MPPWELPPSWWARHIQQAPTIPLPVFKGKKGEDPGDHILKVEDYFAIHEIVDDANNKVRRFKDTLFEKARKWAQTPDYNKVKKFDWDEKAKVSIKYWFMRRFAKEGRTLEAAYDAWISLSFDPSKDNMEELINKVIELAEKLGYNEDAQVMAK